MLFHDLPPEALEILAQYAAPPRLIAHLTVVHDVAVTLTVQLHARWPLLAYDQERVLIGAAIHDIGKAVYTNELTGPGTRHEEAGLSSSWRTVCQRHMRGLLAPTPAGSANQQFNLRIYW